MKASPERVQNADAVEKGADKPVLSVAEELVNAVTHGFGVLAIAVASPFLLATAVDRGTAAVIGASVFLTTAALLYAVSTVYHALRPGWIKRLFQVIDHIAIFLLIAGTYTPFTLGVLRGPWGWSLFGAVWSLAVVGVVAKALGALQTRTILQSAGFSLALYLAMGWLAILAIGPVVKYVPPGGIVFLFCGGIAYTLGTAFFWHERIPYFHSVWHLFVLAGTSFHFVAVMNYAT